MKHTLTGYINEHAPNWPCGGTCRPAIDLRNASVQQTTRSTWMWTYVYIYGGQYFLILAYVDWDYGFSHPHMSIGVRFLTPTCVNLTPAYVSRCGG